MTESAVTVPGLTPSVLARAHAIAAAGWPIGPAPLPCECGDPRWRHARDDRSGPCVDCPCETYVYDPADALAHAACAADGRPAMADVAEHSRRERAYARVDDWTLGPSDSGRCPRSIQYREKPPPGYVPLPDDSRAADAGTAMHAGVAAARAVLYPWRRHEFEVTIPGLRRPTRCDEYDPITATVDDIKTVGDGMWEVVQRAGGAPESAWKQVHLYAFGIAAAGEDVRRIRLTYIHRESGREIGFVRSYDAAYARAALGDLLALLALLDAGVDLPRAGDGPSTDPQCRRCPARAHCWSIPQARAAGLSPEAYTTFGADPDRQLVAVTGAEMLQLQGAARDAKKKKESCGALLTGIEPGAYGGVEVIQRRRRMPDYKAGFEALLDFVTSLPEEAQPSAKALEVPRRTDTWVEVRPALADQAVPIQRQRVRAR